MSIRWETEEAIRNVRETEKDWHAHRQHCVKCYKLKPCVPGEALRGRARNAQQMLDAHRALDTLALHVQEEFLF